ncbi:MAG: 30S ribosomal protein S27e [Euryarchaeota archaeon]|nr:30S ribosomal protein S27e [Euryarchaeota archaeon]MBT5592648.1 30S ribosomal protein S27e [Euryarchaeota archaeon]
MSGEFIKVSCKDCGNECILFSRATTVISCGVCGATLTNPLGGKANLVGCTVLETME